MLQELGNDHQIRGSPQEGSEETTVGKCIVATLEILSFVPWESFFLQEFLSKTRI